MSTFDHMTPADHPELIAARKRLASLEARTPPGYPLGYTLHWHKRTCTGCGRRTEFAVMNTKRRAGSSSIGYSPTGPQETIYDLPITEVTTTYTSPRCEVCVVYLPRTALPRLAAPSISGNSNFAAPSSPAQTRAKSPPALSIDDLDV